jgi:caa(3)-type oxidase subunit IV
MSEHAAAHHDDSHYWKVYYILLALLTISIVGPLLEIRAVTLITAFGVAVVKAYMVAKNFMHLNVERRYVTYLLLTMLVFMLLFFAAVAPDVMKWHGANWEKPFVAQESSAPAHH